MTCAISSGAGKTRQPLPRAFHCASSVGSKVFLWGGDPDCYKSPSYWGKRSQIVEEFDLPSGHWEQRVTSGPPPPGVAFAACASVDDDLYVYGGQGAFSAVPHNSLHKLNTRSLQWVKLTPGNTSEAPVATRSCGMTAVGDVLVILGGIGRSSIPIQPGVSFTNGEDGRRWTNGFHLYHVEEDMWSFPATTGERPPPCAGITLTSIDHRRAVMFGGYNSQQSYIGMNDAYIIDLHTMHWTRISRPGEKFTHPVMKALSHEGPFNEPEERAFHAACCLDFGEENPQLLITGGMNTLADIYGELPETDLQQTVDSSWILDVNKGEWREIGYTLPHYGHSATAVSLSKGLTAVLLFGGIGYDAVNFSDVLKFGIDTLYLLCLEHIVKDYRHYQPLLQQCLPLHIQNRIHKERDRKINPLKFSEKRMEITPQIR